MLKLMEALDDVTRRISEHISRKVDRKDFIKTSLGAVFIGILTVVANPFKAFAATLDWCQVSTAGDIACSFPGAGSCSNLGATCPSSSSTSKCPSGFTSNKAYYSTTGCWCHYYNGMSRICCDCKRTSDGKECGCQFYVSGR